MLQDKSISRGVTNKIVKQVIYTLIYVYMELGSVLSLTVASLFFFSFEEILGIYT